MARPEWACHTDLTAFATTTLVEFSSRSMTSPFRGPATGAEFFAGPGAHAAELKLAYAVDHALDVALLIASPGLGKTTLLRRAVERSAAADFAVVDLFYPRVDTDELLAFVEAELAEATGAMLDASEPRLRRIAAHACRLGEQDRGILISVDDAHLLRVPAVFEALHLLLNLKEREDVRVTVLLAGQTPLLAELAKCPAFAGRVAVTASLSPLGREETAAYVRHRLAAAGRDVGTFVNAIDAVHERTAGIPRAVNRLCEMALLVADSEGRDRITPADIDAVASETSTALCDAA